MAPWRWRPREHAADPDAPAAPGGSPVQWRVDALVTLFSNQGHLDLFDRAVEQAIGRLPILANVVEWIREDFRRPTKSGCGPRVRHNWDTRKISPAAPTTSQM